MAPACVNSIGKPPENCLKRPPPPYRKWFGPKISSSGDIADNVASKNGDIEKSENDLDALTEGAAGDAVEFEFRLDDPVSRMLPADELISDGKLIPLQFAIGRADAERSPEILARSPETIKSQLMVEMTGSGGLHELSPKAPKCSSRWKELLGLKKTQSPKPAQQKSTLASSMAENAKSLKHFLHIIPKSSSSSDSSSLSLPLLRDSDSESASISSRLSLSSSSSSTDHEDFPRLSFDFDKPNPIQMSQTLLLQNQPRVRFSRVVKSSAPEGNAHESRNLIPRGPSVDSPRLNASGKVIFQGLERSSSSPSSFNGGMRPRPRGMERSYSANVRVTPVLNVPLCTLRGSPVSASVFGFGQLFSPQKEKKEKKCLNSSSNGGSNGTKAKNGRPDF